MTPEEFIRLYLPLGDGLYRVAYRLLGSQTEAEDAVQDLFIKLWSRLDALDDVRSPQAWSLTLMRNLCIDRLRARGTVPSDTVPEDLPEEPPEESSGLLVRTLAAVRALPPRSLELLRLRLVQDLSWEDIARRTGMTEGALRVAWHRLRKQLKKKI